ncbi:MAG: glycosyltransferase [Candidatus Binatia bacterium]
MVIIVYSAETGESIAANLGRPDYSYYFVSKAFRPVLRRFAHVIDTLHPERDVDVIYEKCRSMAEPCVFLSFSPPQGTPTGLKCPTISVFAWEFPTVPTDPFAGDDRYDWRNVFRQHGCAITHSSVAVRAVREAMGNDFPVWSIPAPVWDDYATLHEKGEATARSNGIDLTFVGRLVDFNGCDIPSVPEEHRKDFIEDRSLPRTDQPVRVHLDGVIYTTVFNPADGRKNWRDLVSGFVWAFRALADATLVLKVVHYDYAEVRDLVTDEVLKLLPFKCRVIVLHGYLSDRAYSTLMRQSTYVVNASYGEGQCLPLMESMSAGRPAISPAHTAMEDYVNESNAFVVRSSGERVWWPHDPRRAFRTTRYRIDWESLRQAYVDSYEVAKNDPARYARMSRCAVERLQGYCSKTLVEERLKRVLRERGFVGEDSRVARRTSWRIAVRLTVEMWRMSLSRKPRSLTSATTANGVQARTALRFRAMIVWLFGKT